MKITDTLKQHLPSPLPHPQLHTLIHDSSTPCPKWQAGWGYGLSLQTLPPHTFPLLQCGLSMGCSSFKEISICSSIGSSRGCNTDICSSAWSATFFSPPLPFHPSLTLVVLSAVSNYYFPPHTSGIFWSFLNMFTQRCYQLGWWSQLCPAVHLLELLGTSCVCHRAATGVFSERPFLQAFPLPASHAEANHLTLPRPGFLHRAR